MDQETYQALKNVTEHARFWIYRKYGDRKRLNQNELWEKATLTRDIIAVENWIDETAKEHI